MTEDEKNKLTKKYQEKYRPTLEKLAEVISELVISNDPEKLIFLYE
jgi:hypothetical protein